MLADDYQLCQELFSEILESIKLNGCLLPELLAAVQSVSGHLPIGFVSQVLAIVGDLEVAA